MKNMIMMGYIEGNPMLFLCVLFPFVGGIVSYIIGRKYKKGRDYFAEGITFVQFLLFLWLYLNFNKTGVQSFYWHGFCLFGMYLKLDGFRVLYGLIASFMWMMTTLFSGEYMAHSRNRNRYYMFLLFTLGATTGLFLSEELLTTFLFFEMMSLMSYVWVIHDETKEAVKAAGTYLAVAVIGGLVMLMGLFLLYTMAGAGTGEKGYLLVDELRTMVLSHSSPGLLWPSALCLFIGFGAKAGAFPLHIWLPKAYPAAPAPASALLSGMLTKAGIFGILIISCHMCWHNGSWGKLLLLLGLITMVLGAVLALFSVDMTRILACSSLSQIGFILVGIGMIGLLGEWNIMAVRGTLLHMINHSLLKLVLFLAAGVVYMNVRQRNLNEIRGFGRNKPFLHVVFLIAALGISGVPLLNGYVSKTLLHESIVEFGELLVSEKIQMLYLTVGQMKVIEWIFLISGGLTAAYMLKLYVAIFIEKNTTAEKQEEYNLLKDDYINNKSKFALGLSTGVIGILGLMPYVTMDKLADLGQGFLEMEVQGIRVNYFSFTNLKGATISLLIGGAVYVLLVRPWMMTLREDGKREYCNRFPEYLDMEKILYRPIMLTILPFIGTVISRIGDTFLDGFIVILRKTIYKDSPLPYELTEGTKVTHMTGQILDHIVYYLKRLGALRKEKRPNYEKRFEHKLAVIHAAVKEYNSIISRSMSFGLFLFCVGFLLTMLYLLYFYYTVISK